MLHDFASELALLRPENPRQFLYAKLQRELAAEEKAKEDNEERAPALDGRTDCLRVHTECRAGGRVRRGYFVQRAPLLSDPRLEPGGIAHAASTRFVSWGTEALAAVKSVVHETAGLQAAGPESSGSARARPQLAMHIRSVCSCMLASIPKSQSIQIHTFEHASTHMHLLHACIHTHAHTHTRLSRVRERTHTLTHAHTRTHARTHTHTRLGRHIRGLFVFVCFDTKIPTRANTLSHIYFQTRMRAHASLARIHSHTHAHTRTHTCTHTHTHTSRSSRNPLRSRCISSHARTQSHIVDDDGCL